MVLCAAAAQLHGVTAWHWCGTGSLAHLSCSHCPHHSLCWRPGIAGVPHHRPGIPGVPHHRPGIAGVSHQRSGTPGVPPQTWHPRGPTPAGVSTPQLVIHNQAAAFLHKPSHLSAWLWREGFITSLGAGSPLQIRWFMQTDTSLCRLLISLSWTRSSSSVTAVTSHLNHPTLLSLPALIDAVIFLPSKHPLASCSCAGERGPGPEGL